MSDTVYLPDSFDRTEPHTGPNGQVAHPDHLEHTDRLAEKFYACGDNAWCLVGNGLSNQTFVRGPKGIIAIDTGECVEEMAAALLALRTVTDEPIVAVIYTHFHYVNGTRAILEDGADAGLPIYGHDRIDENLDRYGTEVGPRVSRGMVFQFGVTLPTEGEDGIGNLGIGRFLQNPAHKPYTSGYLPATNTFLASTTATIAGLKTVMMPAPSDADDSITIWFPELDLAINNLVWPALFNIFAIRGEAYRDPRVLLTGLDHLLSLDAEFLLGAHGPPLQGKDEIRNVTVDYRDSIQFLWDQTVRGANKGLSLEELTDFVQLPDRFRRTYLTRQFYGVAEHHVRQIHAGLFGWFDEDESKLFPMPAIEKATRMIKGFGGANAVRTQLDSALTEEDYRWAIELGCWLVRTGNEEADRLRLAMGLRGVAQHSTSANIRNWCLTRARELSGDADLSRFRTHRFRMPQILQGDLVAYVHVLRVLLDPITCSTLEQEMCWQFASGEVAGLRIRRSVAVPTDGSGATLTITLDRNTWAEVLGGKLKLSEAIDNNRIGHSGARQDVLDFFAHFDLKSLQA